MTLMKAALYSGDILSDSESARTIPGPWTEAAKWNSATIYFIVHNYAFPAVTSQTICFCYESKSTVKVFLQQ